MPAPDPPCGPVPAGPPRPRRRSSRSLLAPLGCLGVLALLLTSPSATGLSTTWTAAPVPQGGAPAVSSGLPAPHGGASGATRQISWRSAAGWGDLSTGGGLAAVQHTGSAIGFGWGNFTSRYWLSNNTWNLLNPGLAPSARSDFAFGEDGELDEDILFGGETNSSSLASDNQTWTYSVGSDSWTQVVTSVAPAPRQDAGFAVATYLSEALLYGGWNQSTGAIYGDTWAFDTSSETWSPVAVSGPSPSRLAGASMVWDNAVHRFDLFGGCYLGCTNTLWQFDPWNLTWTSVTATTAPPARQLASFVFDSQQGVDLLFGGEGAAGALADTWVFAPSSDVWTQQTLATVPPARYDAPATWLSVANNESFFVVGGTGSTGNTLLDAWLASPSANVPVQVLSSLTDLPITSATVTADGSFAALTNAQGYGNASEVAAGSATVAASAVGYGSASQSLWLYPDTTHALVILYLVPNPSGELIVHVTSATWPHVALPNVDVNVTVGGVLLQDPPKTTDAHGYANYTGVPTGVALTVDAWRAGWYQNQTTMSVPVVRSVAFWNSTLVTLPEITVHSMGSNSVAPGPEYEFPGVSVFFGAGLYGPTGGTGWLNVSFARTGPVSVEGTFTNYVAGWGNVTLPVTGQVWANLSLVALTGSTIVISTTDQTTGLPWPAVDVNDSFAGGPFDGVTNASGDLRDGRLRSGPNTITFWAPGAYAQLAIPWLYPGQIWYDNVSLIPLPILHLQAHGIELNGTHVDLVGTEILWNGAPSGVTGALGFLNYTPAREGLVEFEGLHADYYAGFLNYTVLETGIQWANITLDHLPTAMLSVRVLDRDDGRGIADALVNATLPGGLQVGTTNLYGYANFTDVVGWARAGATKGGFYSAIGGVALVADASVELDLRLVPWPSVHLRVYGENDTSPHPYPLEGATVSFNGTVVGETLFEGYDNSSLRPGGNVWINASSGLYYNGSPLGLPAHTPEHLNYTGTLNVTIVLEERPLATLDIRLFDVDTGISIPFGYANATNRDESPTSAGGSLLTLWSGWANFTADLGAGNYTVTGFHSGYEVATEHLRLFWGGTNLTSLYLTPIQPWPKVFVDVVDRNDTAKVIPGAFVGVGPVYGFVYQTTTNALGNATFPLPDIPGGSYEVEVTAQGYWGWESPYSYALWAGSHVSLYVELLPAPPVKCQQGAPGCVPNPNGSTTKGTLSLLPFASGPYWPFLLLPPLFLLGALVLFLATRKPKQPPPRRPVAPGAHAPPMIYAS